MTTLVILAVLDQKPARVVIQKTRTANQVVANVSTTMPFSSLAFELQAPDEFLFFAIPAYCSYCVVM